MLRIIFLIVTAFLTGGLIIWVIDHEGFVLVNWLGYELKTNIVTAITLSILFTATIFAISYFFIKIISIKFPHLAKILLKKSYFRNLEDLVKRHQVGFESLTELLLAMEVNDIKAINELKKLFSKSIKNNNLNNFINGKIAFIAGDFYNAESYFLKINHHKNIQNLIWKSKFNIAKIEKNYESAIACANEILAINKNDINIAKELFLIYKKQGRWQNAKLIVKKFGADKFQEELQKRDRAISHCAIALEAYRNKKFNEAIREAKMALKIIDDFLPAIEIMLKSWVRNSMSFLTVLSIKRLWHSKPHMIFIDIFYLINRKLSKKDRLKSIKKLVKPTIFNRSSDKNLYLNDIAIARTALHISDLSTAKSFAKSSLEKEKNFYAYQLLIDVAKIEQNSIDLLKNLDEIQLFKKQSNYVCDICDSTAVSWSDSCRNCNSYDSFSWNN